MIAVVVPTAEGRETQLSKFKGEWVDLFFKHRVRLVVVKDGETPTVNDLTAEDVLGEDADLIFNRNDGVRNLGFAYVHKHLPEAEYIITLDDDVKPLGDTIQDHIDVLNRRMPISWTTTLSMYPRGFPYGVREEAEVVLSHGVWSGVKDWDAPTQLVLGNPDVTYKRGPIPKGALYPMCGMNIAFKRKALPYMYFAPMGPRVGLDRFADIWCGITSKREFDRLGWAVVTGYAAVEHDRASNVFTNLEKEAKGIRLNETFWEDDSADPYFIEYKKLRNRWKDLFSQSTSPSTISSIV